MARGTPHLMEDYSATADVFTRMLPALTGLALLEVLGAGGATGGAFHAAVLAVATHRRRLRGGAGVGLIAGLGLLVIGLTGSAQRSSVTAPGTPGTYTFTVTATDEEDNSVEERILHGHKSLPRRGGLIHRGPGKQDSAAAARVQ